MRQATRYAEDGVRSIRFSGTACLAVIALVVCLTGCGSKSSTAPPITVAKVKNVFRTEGVPVGIVRSKPTAILTPRPSASENPFVVYVFDSVSSAKKLASERKGSLDKAARDWAKLTGRHVNLAGSVDRVGNVVVIRGSGITGAESSALAASLRRLGRTT